MNWTENTGHAASAAQILPNNEAVFSISHRCCASIFFFDASGNILAGNFRLADHPGVVAWRLESSCRVGPLLGVACYSANTSIAPVRAVGTRNDGLSDQAQLIAREFDAAVKVQRLRDAQMKHGSKENAPTYNPMHMGS